MRNIRVSNGAAIEKMRAAFNRPEVTRGLARAREVVNSPRAQEALSKARAALSDPRIKSALGQARGRVAAGSGRRSNWNPRRTRNG